MKTTATPTTTTPGGVEVSVNALYESVMTLEEGLRLFPLTPADHAALASAKAEWLATPSEQTKAWTHVRAVLYGPGMGPQAPRWDFQIRADLNGPGNWEREGLAKSWPWRW